MNLSPRLPVERILDSEEAGRSGLTIGQSRDGREIDGFVLGSGKIHVSLIGGCHADEPVGPATLARLAGFLDSLDGSHPLLAEITWRLVPHVNPDGQLRNESWTRSTVDIEDHLGQHDQGYQLDAYLARVVREPPGDDIEFGFPRSSDDHQARPENRAVADFLAAGAPFDLHGSFHGMGFAPGPWFLIEESWIGRSQPLRDEIRSRVRTMGYGLFDPDRKGEKGFNRIDPGFSTRPDSRAMSAFFAARADSVTASKFRPSSMEHVRRLGGDPFTFVSEMPLFLTPLELKGRAVGIPELGLIRAQLDEQIQSGFTCESLCQKLGVQPMPVRDQQRLQLTLLDESLEMVRSMP
jgi:hypothetical protein